MKLLHGFILALAPLVIAQALTLNWLFVTLSAAVGIASALLVLVPAPRRPAALLLLVAVLTAGISVSVPVLGIGNHQYISTGSLGAQALLWLPAVSAVLVAYPESLQTLRTGPQKWLTLLLMSGLLLSPFASDPVAAVAATMSLLAITFVAAAATELLGSPSTFRAMALGIAVFVAISLLFARPGSDWNWAIGETQRTQWGLERFSGFAAEPMHLSLLAGLGTVLALSTLHHCGSRLRIPLLAGLAISGFGTLLGQGRIPIVAVIAGSLWFLLRAGNTKGRFALLSMAAIAVLVLSFASPGQLLRRDGGGETFSELNGRAVIWPIAADLIRERPLIGYGAAGSEAAFTRTMEQGSLRLSPVRNAHNRGLEVLIMFGLMGLTLTAIAIGSSLRGFTRGGAPEAEAVLLYLLVSGLTTPGSGSAFVDPLVMAFVVALVGLATNSSDYRTLRPGRTQSEGPALPAQSVSP
jgi:O-antigen ligase